MLLRASAKRFRNIQYSMLNGSVNLSLRGSLVARHFAEDSPSIENPTDRYSNSKDVHSCKTTKEQICDESAHGANLLGNDAQQNEISHFQDGFSNFTEYLR